MRMLSANQESYMLCIIAHSLWLMTALELPTSTFSSRVLRLIHESWKSETAPKYIYDFYLFASIQDTIYEIYKKKYRSDSR